MPNKVALFVVVCVGAIAPFASDAWGAPAPVADYASIARDIVPAGEYQSIPTPSTLPAIEPQAQMYNALTPLFNNVTATDLTNDFKAEPINVADAPGPITQESVPHAGVTIYRDAYNVPYIYGSTNDDLTWAAGWIEAEDQGMLLQEARYHSAPSIGSIC